MKTNRLKFALLVAIFACLGPGLHCLFAQDSNVMPNPGFEDGMTGWQIGEGDSQVTDQATHTGSYGLRVINDGTKPRGSNASSSQFTVTPGQNLTLKFWARSNDKGAALYVRYFSDTGRPVNIPKPKPNEVMAQMAYADAQWHPYTMNLVVPDAASSVSFWVHTYSTAKCVIDFDDFEFTGLGTDVKVVEPRPYVAPDKPKPIDWNNIPKPAKPINIILKLDDLIMRRGMPDEHWQKMADYIDSKGIKCTMGMICEDLPQATPQYIQWVKAHHDAGNWEFWFHGWDHKAHTAADGNTYNEFQHRSYDEQKKRLTDSQKLAYEKFGFHFTCFGPPGSGQDAVTHKVMIDDPYITTWLYPSPLDDLGKTTNAQGKIAILDRVWGIGVEVSVGAPDFEAFVRGYIDNVTKRDYFTMQGHPAMWNDYRFDQFTKIIEFLIQQKANFVLPSEYAATLRK